MKLAADLPGAPGKNPSLPISASPLSLPDTEALSQRPRRIVLKRFALKAAASVFGSAEPKNCADVTCDEEQVRCSQSDARSRPSRAGQLGGCFRGTAAWNQAPSCWLLTPHTTRCNQFHAGKKAQVGPPPLSPLQTHSHQISASGDGCRIDFQNWTVTVYQPPTTNTHTRAHINIGPVM